MVVNGDSPKFIIPLEKPKPWIRLPATIGREEAIQDYHTWLEQNGFVVIKGRPGIGKTQILASLVEANLGKTIIWLDCARLDGLDSAIWEIAQSINDESLFDFLQLDRLLEYPNSVKLRRLIYALVHFGVVHLLCLDNAHAWYADPALVNLILELRDHVQYVQEVSFRVVMVTQQTPHFLDEPVFEFLGGANQADLHAILTSHGYHISEELSKQIHELTQGNPRQALIITQQIAGGEHFKTQEELSSDAVTQRALQNQALENELAWRPYESLSREERLILQATAVFTEPVSPTMLKAILRGESIRDVKMHQRRLVNKYLLQKVEDYSRNFTISPLDRAFYLEEADLDVLQSLNKKAGDYYTLQDNQELAQYHYDQAQQYAAL